MRSIILLTVIGAAIAAPQDVFSPYQSPRIVGGVEASVEEFPFMSHLLIGPWGVFNSVCGGSLIRETAVLSAAHCLDPGANFPINVWRIRVGSSSTWGGGELLQVEELVYHPRYITNLLYHDIGILKLSTPAVLSNKIGLATLAPPNIQIPDNSIVTTIGFGALASGGFQPDVLQKVDIETINHETCTSRYAYLKTIPEFGGTPDITPENICAGIPDVGGKDGCQGDSGGPLIYNSSIIGVVSWGHDCAHPYFPGVFVRISSYYDWIIDNL